MALEDILVHRATPISEVRTGGWVEGEYDEEPLPGTPFDCVLFLPLGTESSDGRGRRVREPTLLYGLTDDSAAPVALNAEDELLIVAPELNVAEGRASAAEVRWMLVGAPQPLGKPGEDVLGFQATLRRVED